MKIEILIKMKPTKPVKLIPIFRKPVENSVNDSDHIKMTELKIMENRNQCQYKYPSVNQSHRQFLNKHNNRVIPRSLFIRDGLLTDLEATMGTYELLILRFFRLTLAWNDPIEE